MKKYLCCISLFILLPHFALAQPKNTQEGKKRRFIIGIIEQPPFIIRDIANSYYGLSIDLWTYLANQLDIDYQYKVYDNVQDVLLDLNRGSIDVFLNPMYVTGTRIRQLSVSMPYFISSIGLAVKPSKNNVSLFFSTIFSSNFLHIISFLALITFLFGIVIWIVERQINYEDFRPSFHGILDGLWWSAVTITTVGYGDKTPKTLAGKIISILWMFSAVTIISSITAALSSNLNLSDYNFKIEQVKDITNIEKIGVVGNSDSESYLQAHEISPLIQFNTCLEGLQALERGEVNIFVYDKSIMHYLITNNKMKGKVNVLPITFNKQYFSLLMPKAHPLLSQIDPILVEKLYQDSWKSTLKTYNLND